MIVFAEFKSNRFFLFIGLFIVFSFVYLIICDDPTDFGGISVLQDSIRTTISEDIIDNKENENFIINKNIDQNIKKDIVRDLKQKTKEEKKYKKYTFARWFNMLYFSLSNTVTMGYGDIYPISYKSKCIVCVQILLLLTILCVTK
tara:strand:- start:24 stop:458 length:435 start_codon:yes stop_codon:yes gene_type:complete